VGHESDGWTGGNSKRGELIMGRFAGLYSSVLHWMRGAGCGCGKVKFGMVESSQRWRYASELVSLHEQS
jgi:hypothetical protein